MAEAAAAPLNRYNSAEIGGDQVADRWAPPIAPYDSFLHEEAFDAATGDEHFFQPADESGWHQILRSSGPRNKLIVGITVVATLTISALAYVYWPTAVEKTDTKTAEITSAVQSIPVAPASRNTEPTFVAPTAVAWPDFPPSGTVAAFPQIASAVHGSNSEVRQAAPASQNREIVWVQRPGVNIRSAPSTQGSVVGSAPKGKRFKVAKREGDWVQVENDPAQGWIKSEFLASTKPQ